MRIVFAAFHGSVHTRRWASFIARRGHEVHVVTCGGTGTRGGSEAHDASHYTVHDLGTTRLGGFGYLSKIPAARKVVRELKPDIVHAHYATSYGLLALVGGVHPLVVTVHGDDVLIAPQTWIKRQVVARVLRSADLITIPGEHMRAPVERLLSGRKANFAIFQYGVEARRLAAVASSARSSEPEHNAEARAIRRLRIVSARPLLKLYRVDALISALAILHRRGVAYSCHIAGDGPERPKLVSLSKRLGVSDMITFYGHVPERQVEWLIGRSDIYVSVAVSDGVSLALLEALALGAVPVLSNIPANRSWVVDGVTGILVDIDPVSIANGIQRGGELSRSEVAEHNLRLALERGDRETNLGACEVLLASLCGDK